MDIAVFFSEVASQVAALVIAATLLALGTWLLARWKWKPHLSVDQSASWRWLDDDTFCITVSVRYRNTSTYRKIRLTKMSVELQLLAPLSPRETWRVEEHGGRRNQLPFLQEPRTPWQWEKKRAPVVEPGESESEICIFFLPKDKAVNLKAFVAYTFIHKKWPREGKTSHGWGVATCYDIQ